MKEITYNKEFLATIRKLSKDILKETLIKKEGEKVAVKMKTDKSIYVDLNSPVASFDFDGDRLAFAEGVFDKFYKFFECFNNPTISQNEKDLVMKEGRNSIKYRVSDPDLIDEKKLFKGMKQTPESIVKISLSKEQFKNIKDMLKMVGTEDVVFRILNDKVIVTVANENAKNSYDFEIDLESPPSEEVDMEIKSTIFDSAPELDYEVNITNVGLFHFKSANENFELNLYTGMKSQ